MRKPVHYSCVAPVVIGLNSVEKKIHWTQDKKHDQFVLYKVTANQDKWCFQFKHISEFEKLSLDPFKSVLPIPSVFLCIITDGINTNLKTSVRFSSGSNSWRHWPFKRFARKSIRSTLYHTGQHAYQKYYFFKARIPHAACAVTVF